MARIPSCPMCTPHWTVSPSGGGWFHQSPCPKSGHKIYPEIARAKATHPARGLRRPLRVLESVVVLPVPVVGLPSVDEDRCPAHPSEDRWDCPPCNALGEGYGT